MIGRDPMFFNSDVDRAAEDMAREFADYGLTEDEQTILADALSDCVQAYFKRQAGDRVGDLRVECPLCPPGLARIDCPGHDSR